MVACGKQQNAASTPSQSTSPVLTSLGTSAAILRCGNTSWKPCGSVRAITAIASAAAAGMYMQLMCLASNLFSAAYMRENELQHRSMLTLPAWLSPVRTFTAKVGWRASRRTTSSPV